MEVLHITHCTFPTASWPKQQTFLITWLLMQVVFNNKHKIIATIHNIRLTGYNRSMFDIYSVEYLFYALRNAVADDKVFATVGVADLELAKDVFEFTQGMACPVISFYHLSSVLKSDNLKLQFHESTDVPQMCSLSVALRTIYAICSHCCKDMGVSLVPGQHVPLNAVIRNTNSIKEEDVMHFFSH